MTGQASGGHVQCRRDVDNDWTKITGASRHRWQWQEGSRFAVGNEPDGRASRDNTIWSMAVTELAHVPRGRRSPEVLGAADADLGSVDSKYILIGIGNDQASIWRSTFNGGGMWNSD